MSFELKDVKTILNNDFTKPDAYVGDLGEIVCTINANDECPSAQFTTLAELRFSLSGWFEDLIRQGEVREDRPLLHDIWVRGDFVERPLDTINPKHDLNTEEVYVSYKLWDSQEYDKHREIVYGTKPREECTEEEFKKSFEYVMTGERLEKFMPSFNSAIEELTNIENSGNIIKVDYILFFESRTKFTLDLVAPKLLKKLQKSSYNNLFKIVEKGLKYSQNGYWFS